MGTNTTHLGSRIPLRDHRHDSRLVWSARNHGSAEFFLFERLQLDWKKAFAENTVLGFETQFVFVTPEFLN